MMNKFSKIDIIGSICSDLQESIADLFDILQKQQKSINEINATLANKKAQKNILNPHNACLNSGIGIYLTGLTVSLAGLGFLFTGYEYT